MTVIKMKCSACGADIQVDDANTYGFCMYCGAKVQIKAPKVEGAPSKDKTASLNELKDLIEKAESGDVDAQYNVGSVYFSGKNGIQQNYEEAFKWYTMAAENGDPFAMYSLSIMYFGGLGIGQSCGMGNYWTTEAAKHGFNERCRERQKTMQK